MKNFERWKGVIVAKMKAENVVELSTHEIHRAFSGCVARGKLTTAAIYMAKNGLITAADLQEGVANA